jgi:hypothetical protein
MAPRGSEGSERLREAPWLKSSEAARGFLALRAARSGAVERSAVGYIMTRLTHGDVSSELCGRASSQAAMAFWRAIAKARRLAPIW